MDLIGGCVWSPPDERNWILMKVPVCRCECLILCLYQISNWSCNLWQVGGTQSISGSSLQRRSIEVVTLMHITESAFPNIFLSSSLLHCYLYWFCSLKYISLCRGPSVHETPLPAYVFTHLCLITTRYEKLFHVSWLYRMNICDEAIQDLVK